MEIFLWCRSGAPLTRIQVPGAEWSRALSGEAQGSDERDQEPERSRPRREGGGGRPSLTQPRSRPLPGRPGHQRQQSLRLLLPRLRARGSECVARPPGVTGLGHPVQASPGGGRRRSARDGRRRGKQRARRRRGRGGREGPTRPHPPAAPWPPARAVADARRCPGAELRPGVRDGACASVSVRAGEHRAAPSLPLDPPGRGACSPPATVCRDAEGP